MGGVAQQIGDGVGDESRVKKVAEEVIERCREDGLAPVVNQNDEKVLWERFLPVRTIKVLLVENDDSTRQVLTALLHNCGYDVTASANGLQAWKILEDLTNHIDLVLADVVMPCISGVSLLSKIMSHKTCKTIPVIMMSSNDSVGIVVKCLSEGAVDFLVKPIRKNELKNLWQHVWRRCHSSSGSGSGSESGIQTQKSPKSKRVDDDSDNHSGSNDEDDHRSIGLNAQDATICRSGTQGSWENRAVGVDVPQPMSLSDQLSDPHDNISAHVIHPKSEMFFHGLMPMTTTRNVQEQKGLADNTSMGKYLEIVVPGGPYEHPESHPGEKASMNQPDSDMETLNENETKKDVNDIILEPDNNENSGVSCAQTADLIGGIAKSTDFHLGTWSSKDPESFLNMSETMNKTIIDNIERPSLELSLKRLRSSEDDGTAIHDDHIILRHSNQSAFSRYNTSAVSAQAPTGDRGSCSLPLDNISKARKADSTHNMLSDSSGAPLKQSSKDDTDQNDMGSTTKNVFTRPAAPKEKLASSSMVKLINSTSVFHPGQNQTLATQLVVQEKLNDMGTGAMAAPSRGIHIQVHFQHHHRHYNNHNYHVHRMQQQQEQPHPPADHDNLSLKNMETDYLQCGSSQLFVIPAEGNAPHLSLKWSISDSNHQSNGQNGSSTAAKDERVITDSDNGIAGKSGVYGSSGSGGSGSRGLVDQNHSAQGEAVLNKFRQKRKERNFERKVRYQSRKTLAEQQPHLNGQFERQIVYVHTQREAKS